MKSDVHSKLLRIRAKVPMYRLFVKIFLWFWFTVWGILAIVFLCSRLTGMQQVTAPNMYATVAPILAAEAVNAYETGGPEAFARFSHRDSETRSHKLYLLDGYYKDVLSRPLTDDGLRVAHLQAVNEPDGHWYEVKGFSRDEEMAADNVGFKYALRAGYDPAGLKDFLAAMVARGTADKRFFSTHPALPDRVTEQDKLLKEASRPGARNPERFQRALLGPAKS